MRLIDKAEIVLNYGGLKRISPYDFAATHLKYCSDCGAKMDLEGEDEKTDC